MCYYDRTNSNLKCAINASGAWATEVVDSNGDVGAFSPIAVDSMDNVHISYYDQTNHSLKYATNAFGYWDTQTVDNAYLTLPNGYIGAYSSIAVDFNDNVHISYLRPEEPRSQVCYKCHRLVGNKDFGCERTGRNMFLHSR